MFAYLRFQSQRRFRYWRRRLRSARVRSVEYTQRYVWGKWRQLGIIRRLVVIWFGVLILSTAGLWGQINSLHSYYLTPGPIPGGQYVEGMVGQIKLINPVLPENSSSADISRLIFSGLVQIGPDRTVLPDLASSWSTSPDGRSYTFLLRHDVKWHDGVPFTARDVLFTLTAIQNPDTRSPLASSWLGVKAEARDDYTVVLSLPSPYSPFLYSATVGILPSHVLETSDPSALRVAGFNQHPIGTGPFKLKNFAASSGEVELQANVDYYGGRPKLDGFSFRLFSSYEQVLDAYAKRQITAVSRWQPDDPASSRRLANLRFYQLALPDQTDLFLRNTSPLLASKAIRTALALAVDRRQIIDQGLGGYGVALSEPLLPGQLGYSLDPATTAHDLAAAKKALTDAGWNLDANGTRTKDGQALSLKLVTSKTDNYPKIARLIISQWNQLGIKVDMTTTDLSDLQQTYIRPRNYDVLLYGLNIGADPDVYVYWHSSQANDPGLNLSQYASNPADKALESGRILSDPDIRTGKYRTFLQTWNADIPAIVLYRPDYLYAVNGDVRGITAHHLVDPSDRFYNVQNWTTQTVPVPKRKLS